MKKTLLLIFLLLGLSCYGQTPFKGFFRPLERSLFQTEQTIDGNIKADEATSFWLFRPVFTLTAMQFDISSPVMVHSLNSLGTGLSYQHIINSNGEPYANYGFNALILYTQDIGDVEPAKLSIALTGMAWQYVNAGVGYSFANKQFFILTGLSYSFN